MRIAKTITRLRSMGPSLGRPKPLNAQHMAAYERLLAAQQQIAQERRRHGASEAAIERAFALGELDDGESGNPDDDDLSTLTRFVAALGGELVVSAVFPEGTIVVPHEPGTITDPETP